MAAALGAVAALGLGGCESSAGTSPSGDASVPDPLADLLTATAVAIGTGDLDGDGTPEIVLSPRSSADAGAPGPAPSRAAPGTVVFTHGASGALVLAQDLLQSDFSQVQAVASMPQANFATDLAALDASVNAGGCGSVGQLVNIAAKIASLALALPSGVGALVRAIEGALGIAAPTSTGNPDEDFAYCVTQTPQTPAGCFLIQVVLTLEQVCQGSANPLCDLVAVRPHCYQVAPPGSTQCTSPPARSLLCDKTTDATGCCNAAFVLGTVLQTDVRNQAPNPLQPPFGAFALPSTAILGGPTFDQLAALVTGVLPKGSAAALCGISMATRNPIEILANPDSPADSVRNETQPGHILEGNVDQFVTEDSLGVYSSIVGSSTVPARLAGLNEEVGPVLLGTVRDHFAGVVGQVLGQIAAGQMCCVGADLFGGTLSLDSSGNVSATPSGGAGPTCGAPGMLDGGAPPSDAADEDEGDPTPTTTAVALGDPHLLTFDRERYDCQVWGETTLCRSVSGDFEVQMRTHPLRQENVAVITGVAARVGTERVAFYLDGTATQDGQPATFGAQKTTLSGDAGVVFKNAAGQFVVAWPDKSQLRVGTDGTYMSVQIFLADGRRTQVSGLFGNANGDAGDDLAPRGGGSPLVSPATFASFYGDGGYANSWRVTPDASLFDYPDGQSTLSPEITNLDFPRLPETADGLGADQADAGALACGQLSVTPDWTSACALDVALEDAAAASAFVGAPPVAATFDILSPCAACTAGQICCDGVCTVTAVDPTNCGTCGQICATNGATCSAGACGCQAPKATLCRADAGTSAECIDLASDSANCGACGVTCSGATPVCSGGVCAAACNTASGQKLCGTQCVTLGNDPSNCGSCGNACGAADVCSGGVCTPPAGVSAVGCADGKRDANAFADTAVFPAIAACAGGWDGNGGTPGYTGVFPAPLRTPNANCAQNGNDGPNPNGTGCSAIDLCAAGWHICAGGEIIARVRAAFDAAVPADGCVAATWPAGSFFAAAIGSTGCGVCAEPYDTLTGSSCTNTSCVAGCEANPAITNDIFGCGGGGGSDACGDVDRTGGNVCGSLGPGWSCGSDGARESVNAVHNPAATGASIGGVLCCAAR